MTTTKISPDWAGIAERAEDAARVAASRVISEELGAYEMPQLIWSFRGDNPPRIIGYANIDHEQADVPAVLRSWADALELAESPESRESLLYVGEVQGVQVEVWGIVDRAAWEQAR